MKHCKRNSFSRVSVFALTVLMVACLIGVGVQAESMIPAADPSPAAYVASKNVNSVVGVLTYADEWSRETGVHSSNIGQGSGVVIREGGYVLTNNHVIADGSSWKVLLPSGEKVEAELIGADEAMDLAVLKLSDGQDSGLTPVEFGSTSELLVGSTVVAIGNPGGEVLANSVTQGIVSALERSSVEAAGATRSIDYIQHDAAINSGNSGGGLFNYKGQLIGINTLKMSGSAYSSVSFEGLGFAIPVETVTHIADDLIEYGKVIRPALGVRVADYDGPEEPLTGNPPASICIYEVTEGGAAEAAGLQTYDFIYKVNGERVTTMIEMTGQLDKYEPGDTVDVTVIRYRNAGLASASNYYNGYGFGFGGGMPNGMSNEVVVSGGFEEVTVQVVLEELE